MRNLIVGSAWLTPFVLIVLWPTRPLAGLLLLLLSHVLWLYGTLHPNVQWFGPVVTRFQPQGREVWLTIDDGPSGDTPALLDLLEAKGVRATFFVKGVRARSAPEWMNAIAARGHAAANHSHTHPAAAFWCLPGWMIESEIDQCAAVIGRQPYFRAPVGMKNPAVHPILARRNMRLIGWTARGYDTLRPDSDSITRRIVRSVEPGAIVVMHQGRPHSLACIARVIDTLQRDGYAFVIPSAERLKTKR